MARLLALLTALCVILSGCMLRRQDTQDAGEVPYPEPSAEPLNMILGERLSARARDVTLYYATSDGAGFSSVTRSLRAETPRALIEAAVNALLTASPGGESMYFSVGDTRLLSSELACGVATVDLSIDARNVPNEQELLALTVAIGNTLLGIDGVDAVNVLIGGRSESFCQLPMGVQTEIIPNITAAYAQLQSERDHFLQQGSLPITRSAAIYFPTQSGAWLVPEVREITFDSADLAGALVDALKAGPRTEACAISSIPEGVELLDDAPQIQTISSGEHVLSLNFSSTLANYLAFSGLEVWEMVGSVALTMGSFLPEVDAVRVLVNSEPVTVCEIDDNIAKFPGGLIRRGDFSGKIGSVAQLYLVNQSRHLEPVRRAVSMRSALSPRSLLTELFSFAGRPGQVSLPLQENIYAEDLLGVQVTGGIARVNLSAEFYRICQTLDADDERLLTYAMVNTLCQLDGVRGVRFYVEGLPAQTLSGSIYLRSALLPNPGLVDAPQATAAP